MNRASKSRKSDVLSPYVKWFQVELAGTSIHPVSEFIDKILSSIRSLFKHQSNQSKFELCSLTKPAFGFVSIYAFIPFSLVHTNRILMLILILSRFLSRFERKKAFSNFPSFFFLSRKWRIYKTGNRIRRREGENILESHISIETGKKTTLKKKVKRKTWNDFKRLFKGR